jgi:hypothetical protein
MHRRNFVIGLLSLFPTLAIAKEQYPGQYAQYPPDQRKWFREQTSPKTGNPCCSEADGTFAEEDIREGQYWVKFTARDPHTGLEFPVPWTLVPDDVIIKKPNYNGSPVVWYGLGGGSATFIRCFIPGAGL